MFMYPAAGRDLLDLGMVAKSERRAQDVPFPSPGLESDMGRRELVHRVVHSPTFARSEQLSDRTRPANRATPASGPPDRRPEATEEPMPPSFVEHFT
jgi:hypothetical protein